MPIITNITLSNAVNLIRRDKSVVEAPLSHAAFTLDSSGVAGFFGGESAVRAMATVNLLPKRRWCGWYNAPGSYEVAKQYSPLAMSDIFDGLFPGSSRDPAKILMVDGQSGSKYISVHSPTDDLSHIGHLGYLFERKASQVQTKKTFPRGKRHTMDARVSLVRLNHMPDEFEPLAHIPTSSITFALGTVLISVGGCVACALVGDWFSFASIALGIIANGVACSVIGSGKLILKHNIPAQTESPGDVVLKGDGEIIVLIGSSGAVSPFTRDRFVLQYNGNPDLQPEQVPRSGEPTNMGEPSPTRQHNRTCWPRIPQKYLVRASVTLLLSQFLAQLLLVPQGTLFGQLMFIATLVPSWMYHSYLSSLSLDFQTLALFDKLRIKEEDIYRYQLNTWTEAVVFTCLALTSVRHKSYPEASELQNKLEELLDGLLPSKTDVWQAWKKSLAKGVVDPANFQPEENSPRHRFDWGTETRQGEPTRVKTLETGAMFPGAGTGAATPGANTATPGANTATPGANTATPGANTVTPGSNTVTPVSNAATPGANAATPYGTLGAATSETGAATPETGVETPGTGVETSESGTRTATSTVGEEKRGNGNPERSFRGEDLKQLRMYQEDADGALKAWGTVWDTTEMRNLRRS